MVNICFKFLKSSRQVLLYLFIIFRLNRFSYTFILLSSSYKTMQSRIVYISTYSPVIQALKIEYLLIPKRIPTSRILLRVISFLISYHTYTHTLHPCLPGPSWARTSDPLIMRKRDPLIVIST